MSLLRECIRRILEDLSSYRMNDDDFETFLEPYGQFSSPSGVPVWAPFQLRKKFVSHSKLASLGASYGATPADAAQTLKKGSADNWRTGVKRPEFRGDNKRLPKVFDPSDVFAHYLEYDNKTRDQAIERMASAIHRHFKSQKFDEVMAVDSSYSMSQDLADRVGAMLGVPVTKVEKVTDPNKVMWDLKAFERWISSGEAYESWLEAREKKPEKTPETFEGYIINTLEWLDTKDYNYVVGLLQKGEKPSALRHIKFRQKFWNFFKHLPKQESARRVLVVDDNVASGLTNVHVKERLEDAGYVPTFVAGYKR